MNRLAEEASPYLKQHADNPVDWYPYGEEALNKARTENRIIFLSIGYSSCHWCHVMARESFSDPKTAEYMNEHFVSIKVDREERPGLDKVMQELYQIVNQRGGGWPLSVWMTPDAKPFFLGTYFPSKPMHNIPSFQQLNEKIVELWETQHNDVIRQAEGISRGISMIESQLISGESELDEEIHKKNIQGLKQRLDRKYGGIGGAPKFPRVSSLSYMLAEGWRKGDHESVDMVEFSFLQMARGGIYDQLGGGFARYSVDAKWLVPHFEKMLYDNGALLNLGADLYALTGNEEIKRVLDHTVEWLDREMTSDTGGLFASLNAESEGEEGKFYVWQLSEIEEVLGELEGNHQWGNSPTVTEIVCAHFGITEKGNFRDPHHPEKTGMNILSVVEGIDELAKKYGIARETLAEVMKEAKARLLKKREGRIRPDLDDKIITSWNGIAIRGLLNVYEKTGNRRSFELATGAIEKIRSHIRGDHILRYSKDGQEREIQGILDDYAFSIDAFIAFFELTGRTDYLDDAAKLTDIVLDRFHEPPALYLLPEDHPDSISGRPIQITDDSMASGMAVMVRNLFKLSKYLGDHRLYTFGEDVLKHTIENSARYPGSASELLISSRYYTNYPHEIVYLGRGKIGHEFQKYYLPTRLVYRVPDISKKRDWEVLEGRNLIGEETLYVCKGQTCSLPLETFDEDRLKELLRP